MWCFQLKGKEQMIELYSAVEVVAGEEQKMPQNNN